MASSCFLLFLVSGELISKYSRNWKRKLFYEVLYRKTPEARRGATGGPQGAHTLPRRAPTSGRASHRCGPPGPPPAPPFRLFIHPDGSTLDITRKVQKEVRSRRHRRGGDLKLFPAPCRRGDYHRRPSSSPCPPP